MKMVIIYDMPITQQVMVQLFTYFHSTLTMTVQVHNNPDLQNGDTETDHSPS